MTDLLANAIDALEKGAEVLREFDAWVEEGGLRTFGEWLLKAEPPEDECPPRVIVTPPPTKAGTFTHADVTAALHHVHKHYNPHAHVYAAIKILDERLLQLPGIAISRDLISNGWRVKCLTCKRGMTIGYDGHLDVDRRRVLLDAIGGWYAEHGPNCGRVRDLAHHGAEVFQPVGDCCGRG